MNKKIRLIIISALFLAAIAGYFEFQKSTPQANHKIDIETGNGVGKVICQDSPFGIFGAFDLHQKFMKDTGFNEEEYLQWSAVRLKDLGASWTRQNTLFIWGSIEPDLGKGYFWENDQILESAITKEKNFNLVAVIYPKRTKSGDISDDIFGNEEYLKKFIKTIIEKYGAKIKYWQAVNELRLDWLEKGGTVGEYIQFLRIFSKEIKNADPQAKIILGAEMADREQKLSEETKKIISETCSEKLFDIIDVHYWETAEDYKMEIVKETREHLDRDGCREVEIWSTENGTYVNKPVGSLYMQNPPAQSEKEQATSLIKRYVYNIANGVKKIFWSQMLDHDCFEGKCGGIFDNTGLISDGRNNGEKLSSLGIPRLSYYSYKKMSEIIGCLELNSVQKISENGEANVYKFKSQDKNVWVVWSDDRQEKKNDNFRHSFK